jgi:hypothetical protein
MSLPEHAKNTSRYARVQRWRGGSDTLWIRCAKDTLAVGNNTEAMVFQGNILPIIGLMMTTRYPSPEVLVGVLVTCSAIQSSSSIRHPCGTR